MSTIKEFKQPQELSRSEINQSDVQMMLFNPGMMDQLVQFSQIMAQGKCTVPSHLSGNPGDCLAIAMQAAQWKMNPFSVAQKTHLINGVLGYEAQLVNAVVNSMAPTKDRLNFEFFGPWENVIGKFVERTNDKGRKYIQPAWNLSDEKGVGVKAFATLKDENKPRVLELLLSQATVRNSTLWASDPKQQLAYLAIKRWARLFCPDVILGVYTPDEVEEIAAPLERDISAVASREDEEDGDQLPPYPQEEFEKNFPKWEAVIESGKKDADFVISMASTKGVLSDEQIERIRSVEA